MQPVSTGTELQPLFPSTEISSDDLQMGNVSRKQFSTTIPTSVWLAKMLYPLGNYPSEKLSDLEFLSDLPSSEQFLIINWLSNLGVTLPFYGEIHKLGPLTVSILIELKNDEFKTKFFKLAARKYQNCTSTRTLRFNQIVLCMNNCSQDASTKVPCARTFAFYKALEKQIAANPDNTVKPETICCFYAQQLEKELELIFPLKTAFSLEGKCGWIDTEKLIEEINQSS